MNFNVCEQLEALSPSFEHLLAVDVLVGDVPNDVSVVMDEVMVMVVVVVVDVMVDVVVDVVMVHSGPACTTLHWLLVFADGGRCGWRGLKKVLNYSKLSEYVLTLNYIEIHDSIFKSKEQY